MYDLEPITFAIDREEEEEEEEEEEDEDEEEEEEEEEEEDDDKSLMPSTTHPCSKGMSRQSNIVISSANSNEAESSNLTFKSNPRHSFGRISSTECVSE